MQSLFLNRSSKDINEYNHILLIIIRNFGILFFNIVGSELSLEADSSRHPLQTEFAGNAYQLNNVIVQKAGALQLTIHYLGIK